MEFEHFRDDSLEHAAADERQLLSKTMQRVIGSTRTWSRMLAFSLIAMLVLNIVQYATMMIMFLDEGLSFIIPMLIQSGFFLVILGGPIFTLFLYGQRIRVLLTTEVDDHLPGVFAAQRWMWTVMAIIAAFWGLLISAGIAINMMITLDASW